MLRAAHIVRKPAVKAEKLIDCVSLDHEGRHRRRIQLHGEKGTEFLLDLEKAAILNDGDALKLDDGRLILVKAAPQKLVEIRTENPARLMKAAWHIGNRHTPAEVTADAIYIEDDHVLVEMLRGLGCAVHPVERPFQPERGAYDQAGHHHGHAHDHDHHHGHHHHHEDHAHSHAHAHDHHHDHACGCGHDHKHHHHHEVLDLKSKDHQPMQEQACCGGGCGCNHDHAHQHHHEHLEAPAAHDHAHAHGQAPAHKHG